MQQIAMAAHAKGRRQTPPRFKKLLGLATQGRPEYGMKGVACGHIYGRGGELSLVQR